jgi:hypothetical protein
MVESGKQTAGFLITSVGKDVKIHMGGFVFQNAGKLRDYYRIGKMLGSGRLLDSHGM